MKMNNVCLAMLVLILVGISACKTANSKFKFGFQDTGMPIDQRVDDLVSRLTLDQKIEQLMNQAPGIDSLGIPQYNWWSEGLHGIARAGLATVFPQAIGMAATWDDALIYEVANVISDETRAKHEEFVRRGKRFLYQGLTLWSPNINIFRDPRWGRGQETYGEDPFLTGTLGIQFIRGLQGDDPYFFKTIATVKHFAVHSGPEPERHEFDAKASLKDMNETYLPQFEMGIKEGKAYSLMCAYNSLNGVPCCGNSTLLGNILRQDWDFKGYVVSDCDAIDDITLHHKFTSTPEEGVALAIKAGTDLECGRFFKNLKSAVEQNLISEKELDIALKRLFTARMKLGMFDDSTTNKWARLPYTIVDQPKHRALALDVARKSMVLLKNEANFLPLKKDLKNIAVIGPNADQWLMLLGNYNGVPADAITPLRGIREKLPQARVNFAQGCELSDGIPMFYTIPVDVLFHNDERGLSVEYFNNKDFNGPALYKGVDTVLDVNWKDRAPREDMDDDDFSVRWTGQIRPALTGIYQLGVITTCNTQLYLDDSMVARTVYHFRNEYGDPRLRKSIPIKLEKGKTYHIRIDASETFADAQVQLVWAAPKPDLVAKALAIAKEAEVVILCMGITPRMEGEEMDVAADGFKGGDRTKLALPQVQQDLIRSIQALGKPTVLVLLNGSALAVNWENEHLPAILEAWYPGQAAGTAIADVLFGDYNPGGRLPVTFYKSENDLPPFTQYAMTSQTYRYFKGDALYPFGYGLSYTTFKYDSLILDEVVEKNLPAVVKVRVSNTGARAGDEVVQLYIKNLNDIPNQPIHSLKAYKRIHLDPGESQMVNLNLRADAFAYIDDQGEKKFDGEKFKVFVGGGQPGFDNTSQVVSKVVSLKSRD
ncbi:MAG: glycoside hydrolase family 3 C-terminal domain-containing protein [Saprospiraceae bacterium]|jgi:beta-glucosidase|nr:glycoside hydrolase family 3 C-terminal domain-containing protein [Saprospiraceae bacterium]MBK6815004.1 glycoside hydrolase family 3 C-terminal domain-containing protein [Saprospiraceae bacterium]MBK7372051.1 glycoside hydrolase family 3 C-terminal domain-containing protein [Saprospiraceae bacterium]MBK9681160.1 glycoside hydrolase family 3 C-terminal domain-containing protein [Saprospiraceae bacterium]MBP7922236.1 glycoside hydrolase family 3 C-terminal domain-containing protein [Saprospir